MKTKITLITILSMLLFACDKGEQEMLVIPKNFKGYIVVINNQKSGVPVTYEKGNRILMIPVSGVLKTQFPVNDGRMAQPQFYYGSIAPENKLESFVMINQVPENKVVGFMGPNGSANKDLAGKERISFSFYFVGNKAEIEKYQQDAQKLDIVKLAE